MKATILYNLGKREESIEAYDEAIKLEPKLFQAFYNKGLVLSELGRKEEAREAYQEARKFENYEMYKGFEYLSQSEVEKGIEYLEKGLKIAITIEDRKTQALCYGYIGAAYRRRVNYKKAIEYPKKP